jgi:hypothetical protein
MKVFQMVKSLFTRGEHFPVSLKSLSVSRSECDSGRSAPILHTSWPAWTSTLHRYLHLSIWALLVNILSPTNIRFNIKDRILILPWVFVIVGSNLKEFLGSYRATSVGAGSPNKRNLWGIPSLKIWESEGIPLQLHGKCRMTNSSSSPSKCYEFASYI